MHEASKTIFSDKILILIVVLCIIYFSFWIFYGIRSYTSFFSSYYDLGIYTYDLYWHLHYVQNIFDVRYLVFYNHISPFSILLLPAFALYQNPISLIFIQDFALAATTILVYLITRDIAKRRDLSSALSFAFLISVGVLGLVLFDVHIEAFIPIFYLLAFYFFMKAERKYFIISYVMLLSIMETTFVVGLSLLLGLFVYQYRYGRDGASQRMHKIRLNMIAIGVLLSVLAFGSYYLLSNAIINAYQASSTTIAPPILRLTNYLSGQTDAVLNPNSLVTNTSDPAYGFIIDLYGTLGIMIMIFGFGLLQFGDPVLMIMLCLPWFGEVFIVHNYAFAYPLFQYYGFTILVGSLVSAILSYKIINERNTILSGLIKINSKKLSPILPSSATAAAITIFMGVLLITGEYFYIYYVISNPLRLNYTAVSQAIRNYITANSSVMAQRSIAPHLYYVKELELAPPDRPVWFQKINRTVYWFEPDYIVIDKYIDGFDTYNGTSFNIYNYTKHNYTVIYNSLGLYIFRKKTLQITEP